ncbi:phage minor capsid protein [Streptomyces fragilis]|uniref:Phage minor capsid protein n=1 Tax=Streptomyces fragilis TaxID=67301 RepID=A0ABV2YKY0_9ACTN|nr:phage minor capsid protein [Streptomyces fragilis]
MFGLSLSHWIAGNGEGASAKAERTCDLYAAAEERLLGIIARQLAASLDASGWGKAKLAAVQQVRRESQAVLDELGAPHSSKCSTRSPRRRTSGTAPRSPSWAPCPTTPAAWSTSVYRRRRLSDRLAAEAMQVVTST